MTDKLQQIIDSKFKPLRDHNRWMRDDHVRNIITELMQEFAASEVDRLLDCLVADKAASYSIFTGFSDDFKWYMSHPHDRAQGADKASLLEYVGFVGGDS